MATSASLHQGDEAEAKKKLEEDQQGVVED